MVTDRWDRVILATAAAIAVLVPVLLLLPKATMRQDIAPAPPMIAPSPMPELSLAFARPLFAVAEEASPAPDDAPELIGIAGRLDKDAVAMVRTLDGGTRTMKPGERVDGWELASLAIDAAFFTRGRQRVRVEVPAE